MPQLSAWEQDLLGFSLPVQEEYQRVAVTVRGKLSPEEYQLWVQEGSHLGQSGFRTWQAAVEYFRASPEVLDVVTFARLQSWVSVGADLAEVSAELACAYFRASPESLPHLSTTEMAAWGQVCSRLYRGEWQSGTLAARLFQASPDLLKQLPLSELEKLENLLESVAEHSYPLAQECLELARDLLPRFEAPQREHILSLASVFAHRSPETVRLWLAQAGFVLSRVQHSEQVRFIHIAEALAWLERSPSGVMDYLLAGSESLYRIDQHLHARVLVSAENILNYSANAAKEFLKSADRLLERLHPDELEEWVSEGVDVLRARADAGISFFNMESLRAQETLRHLSRGVELVQLGDLLRLYCKALTGTDVRVQPTENLKQRGIGWTSERKPTTQGTDIFLPSTLEVYDNKADNFSCLKVYATHQAGHLEFGSFGFLFDADGLLFSRLRGDVEKYQGRNGVSITDIERFLDLFALRRLATDIFTLAEDTRVDGYIHREYGGIRSFLRRIQRDTRGRRTLLTTLPLRSAVLEALLQQSLDPSRPVPLPQAYHSHFVVAWGFLSRLRERVCTVEDVAEATLRIYIVLRAIPDLQARDTQLMPWAPVAVPEEIDPEQAFVDFFTLQSSSGQALGSLLKVADSEEDEGPYTPLSDVEFRGDFKPELVQTLMKLKLNNNPDPNAPTIPLSPEALKNLLDKLGEAEIGEFLVGDTDTTSGMFVTNLMREAGQMAVAATGDIRQHEKGSLEGDEMAQTGPREFLYDEWDFRSNDYRHNWCLVKETVLEEGEPGFYDETLRKHAKLANQVRRQFELLKPEMFKKIKNLTDGEEYDLDAVVEAAVDRKSKVTPSEKLYWRRNKEERSVAVAFLLDVSASTDEDVKKEREAYEDLSDWDSDPQRYLIYFRERMQQRDKVKKTRRRIIDVEKESTVLLIQALETVGDAYGVYGFSGDGRDNVELYVIKDLTERFGDQVKARIAKIEPVRGTRMGAAIRHATSKLDAYEARVKVLVLLSDGRPQDHNYGRDRTEKEYAIHDTKQALMEAKQKQIIPFALTVDREGHDYLKTMCEGLGYEVVDDIESLPSRLPTLYRQLTV